MWSYNSEIYIQVRENSFLDININGKGGDW